MTGPAGAAGSPARSGDPARDSENRHRTAVLALTLAAALTASCQRPLAPAPPGSQPSGAGSPVPDTAKQTPPEDGAHVAKIVYAGFGGFVSPADLSQLAGRAPLQEGEPRSRDGVTATARAAVELLQDAGYADARVHVEEARIAPGLVELTIRADPGPLRFFGAIDIVGNQRVDDGVIRRYLAYRPGERFQLAALRESHRRLIALGLFESVEIERVGEPQAPDVRTQVRVAERDQRRIDFSFGYGSEEQLSGELEWRHLNFLGGARRLSLLGRWSWLDRGVQANVLQPYLFRPDLSLGGGGQVWSVDERFFDYLSLGGEATVSYRPTPRTVVGVTYAHRYERSTLDDQALADTGLREDPGTGGGTGAGGRLQGALSALQFDLSRDARDVAWDPRHGYLTSLRLEQAGGPLPGAFDYYSVTGDARYFHTTGRLTLAARARYGSIAPTAGAAGVPYFKRYFLGGADDLRGWGRLEVSPLSSAGLPIGGQSLLSTTGEIRIPIVARTSAVAFVDGGNVWREAWALRLDDLRASLGAGLRYWSPFGPLRLDYGYQLTPIQGLRIDGEPRDRRWRIHFSVGQTF